MAKQEFEPIDYFGPVVVAAIFAITLLLISFFVINFFCITKYDDFTQFEKFGAKHNWRMGPHRLHIVKKGGFVADAYDDDDEEAAYFA
ncbi:hypothetical protein RB195_008303 [Necator americanus]|uniref:Uncharacterized protein n=2 Tax=Necator americanus TaxID=51031 RepID=A0ABR1CMZ8_NECAM|nr:hypothetical protein NECAME_00845 [Necator americanus]ETN71156.1 hypothetical protein NECAME_00845 [Necator americanus]